MELLFECPNSGLRVMLIRGLGNERDCAEREVLDAGVPLELTHRAVWAAYLHRWEPCFLLVRDENGRACAGAAIEQVRTRALPGHLILRVGKFGESLPHQVSRILLQAIAEFSRKQPRVLRLQVNVFSRDRREAIAETMEELGFREVRPPSSYQHTLAIDLKPSEDEIFASLGNSARKRIRETRKMALRSIVISDPMYSERLNELEQVALQRTGGHCASHDWQAILKMSHDHPNLSRVAGLFLNEDTSPANMAAFAWACNHGDRGEYRAAGSQRKSAVRMPFSYLLVWDMIRWAKATGADWFDMGGVTLSEEDDQQLEGISRFKSFFSSNVVEVGAEWVLEPLPMRARIATLVSNSALSLRYLMENRAYQKQLSNR